MAEGKPKMVRLKLTGRRCGKLTAAEGVFYCDARLPAGKQHTRIGEADAAKLIERRSKRLGVAAEQCDLVVC